MKILVLNGSPRPNGATADMVKAFARGAEDMGVFTAHGSENKSEAKRRELYAFGRSL